MLINPTVEVQSYALVLVVDMSSLIITAVSDNAEHFGYGASEELIGINLTQLLGEDVVAQIGLRARRVEPGVVPLPPGDPLLGLRRYQIVIHGFADELVLEIEPKREWPHADDYSARLHNFTRTLEDAPTINVLMQRLCDGLVYHFGYDRVIMLQFDEQFNGLVTHESRVDDMHSFIHYHFAEQDVPAHARYNQQVETVHNYASVGTPMAKLIGSYGPAARELLRRHLACRAPNENFEAFLLDNGLSCSGYLSLLAGDELYGSLYFHSRRPVYLDYQMRAFMAVVGRVAQQKLAFHLHSRTQRLRQAANVIRDRLQDHIVNSDNLTDGLTGGTTTLIDLIEDTHGAAICSDDLLTLFGITPTEQQINGIVGWIHRQLDEHEPLYYTDCLALKYPPAAAFPELAAGLLFLPLDINANRWILWFKPEVVQTVTYGSAASEDENDTRRRFYVHNDTRHGYSLPWTSDDLGTALALQVFIQDVVMQRYASTRRRNHLLQEAYADLEVFSYTVGHDLRAPLRGISSFAEILEEDFAEELGEEGVGHLRVIQENADRMRRFMTDLLALSRVDRNSMIVNELPVAELVERVLKDRTTTEEQSFECVVQPDLPPIYGDHNQLVTVFTNLLANAIKYSSQQEHPRIEVGFTGEYREGSHPVFYVKDNGIGIPADQHRRVFDLFTRSTNVGELQGTGIGLALVQRIIKFHEGEVWIESEPDRGATFFFYTGVVA